MKVNVTHRIFTHTLLPKINHELVIYLPMQWEKNWRFEFLCAEEVWALWIVGTFFTCLMLTRSSGETMSHT